MWRNLILLFVVILFLSVNAAEDKKIKGGNKDATQPTQPPIGEIFSTSNGSNIEEKEAQHPSKPGHVTTASTAIPVATTVHSGNESVTETLATTKATQRKNGNKNEANVDLIIQAPVAKPGSPLIDGIFVAPDKDSLSIAIGGAVRIKDFSQNIIIKKIFLGNSF